MVGERGQVGGCGGLCFERGDEGGGADFGVEGWSARTGQRAREQRISGSVGSLRLARSSRGMRRRFFEWDGLEHQRLGEERAADGGLLLDGADAEGGEARRAGEASGVEQEDGGGGSRIGLLRRYVIPRCPLWMSLSRARRLSGR